MGVFVGIFGPGDAAAQTTRTSDSLEVQETHETAQTPETPKTPQTLETPQTSEASEFPRTPIWVNVGVGLFPYPPELILISAGINVQFKKRRAWQFGWNSAFSFDEYALMTLHAALGKVRLRESYLLAGFAGPALILGATGSWTTYDDPMFPAGVVVNGQAIWLALPDLGFGIDLYGVISPHGVTLVPRLYMKMSNIR